jgi:hypothetical protein
MNQPVVRLDGLRENPCKGGMNRGNFIWCRIVRSTWNHHASFVYEGITADKKENLALEEFLSRTLVPFVVKGFQTRG